MRARAFAPALALVALAWGCGPSSPQMPVGASTGPADPAESNVVVPHPVTEDKGNAAEKAKEAENPPPVADAPLDAKINPAVLGDYRLELSSEQLKAMNESIDAMRLKAMNGDKGAEASYQMALAARDVAEKMVVSLKAGGKYTADFGSGVTTGTFRTGKGIVLLRPDVQPEDPSVPRDVELTFDKASRSLTADYMGSQMVLVRRQ